MCNFIACGVVVVMLGLLCAGCSDDDNGDYAAPQPIAGRCSWVNPLPGGTSYHDVTFLGDHGWAVGYGGVIFTTSDGGHSWSAQPGASDIPLFSVHFANPSLGLAVGGLTHLGPRQNSHGYFMRTEDGGASWQLYSLSNRPELNAVVFSDTLQAWAAGFGGTVLHSMDAA